MADTYIYRADDPDHRRLLLEHLERQRIQRACQYLAEADAALRRQRLRRLQSAQDDIDIDIFVRTRTADVENEAYCWLKSPDSAPNTTHKAKKRALANKKMKMRQSKDDLFVRTRTSDVENKAYCGFPSSSHSEPRTKVNRGVGKKTQNGTTEDFLTPVEDFFESAGFL